MSNPLLPLDRGELDELMRVAEHAEVKARIAFRNAPLRREAIEGACAVWQDARGLTSDCYDASMLLLAAEMDRVLDLGGDNGV